MKNLYEIYSSLLANEENWNPTRKSDIEHDIDIIFKEPNTKNFIMEILFYSEDLHPLAIKTYHYLKTDIEEQKNFLEKISKHAISLYFLGIYFLSHLSLANLNLPKWDSNKHRNFLHHWLAISFFHDLGYFIEKNQQIYPIAEYCKLDNILKKIGVSFDLRETENLKIISNYFEYRVQQHQLIDHGIIGAFMLYDALMKYDQEHQKLEEAGAIIFSEHLTHGESNRNNIAEYAKIIAAHNMWYATDLAGKIIYKNYNLDELIAKEDGSHRININQNPLLFLLCLFDTVEPLKRYIGDNQSYENIEKILKNINIDLQKESSKIIIHIIDDVGQVLSEHASTLEEWIDVRFNKISASNFNIEIML